MMLRRIISLAVLITFLFSNVSYASELHQGNPPQGNINLAPPLLLGPLGDEDHKLLATAQIGLELSLRRMDEIVDIDNTTDPNTIITAFRKNGKLNGDHPKSAGSSYAEVTPYFVQLEQVGAHIFLVPVSVEKKYPNSKVVRKDYCLLFSTLRRDGGFPSVQCTKDELEALKGAIKEHDALPKRVDRDAEAIRRYIGQQKAAPSAAQMTAPVLVLNSGSSSIKYQVIDMLTEKVILKDKIEKIGETTGFKDGETPVRDHDSAIVMILANLERRGIRPIVVGHRVVHGGDKFTGSVLITDEVERAIDEFSDLAPLHNPPNLIGIRACKKAMPDVPQVAVFDTAFHQTMPPRAYTYAIPQALTLSGVRRYGFHGTSHMYVAEEAAKQVGKPLNALNIITLHLGNGASVAAIKGGKSIDTSMGLTPLEGLVMGTRTGDIDAGVVFHLMRKGYTAAQIDAMFNKQSGLKGICGVNDNMEMIALAESGNKDAQLAMEVYIYRICKYVGSYCMALGRVDAIVLTGGIGERGGKTRAEIISRIEDYFAANFIPERRPAVLTIPTNEELVIARDSYNIWQSVLFKAGKVTLPQNPNRTGEVIFAAVDGVNHLVSPKNIASKEKETPEAQSMISRLANGYCAIARAYKTEHSQEPIIAALSYDTFNPDSAEVRNNFNVYIVDRAIELARVMRPEINFYGAGSVQFDTALIEAIGKKKAGAKFIKGKPDIFVFPSFYSYEIALQMTDGIGKDAGAGQINAPEKLDIQKLLSLAETFIPGDTAIRNIWDKARKSSPSELPIIILPEGANENVKNAGLIAHKQGLARIVFSSDSGVEPSNIRSAFAADQSTPLNAGGKTRTALEKGYVDGMVSGIDSPTSKVIQEALFIRAKSKTARKDTFGVYDYFIMRFPQAKYGVNGLVSFVNTAAHTTPNVEELAEMVPMAAANFEGTTGAKSVVALLCGENDMPATVKPAFDKIKAVNPQLDIRVCNFTRALQDGCNVFVFPDLITGNICYKMAERLLGAKAWGPFLMAMADKPIEVSDLSRGASCEDVLITIAILSGRISAGQKTSGQMPAGRPSQGIAGPVGRGSASDNDKGPTPDEARWIGTPVEKNPKDSAKASPAVALEAFIKGAGKMDISSARNFETLKAMSAQEIKDRINNAGLVIGVPKEIKAGAARVGLTPAGVKLLTAYGAVVIVEKGAGVLSGFSDEEYTESGATIVGTAKEVWDRAAIIKKVKEPMGAELDMMRPGQTIFTYLHLASPELRSLTEELVTGDVNAIGYETIETDESGKKVTPLLRPMSAIAGDLGGYFAMFYHLASNISEHEGVKKVVLDRAGSDMAVWVKSHYPEAEEFKGLMLDKKAVILGGGISGEHMAQRLLEAGATVTITDTDEARRKELERIFDKYIQDGRLTVVDPGSDINNPSKELKEIYKSADIMGGCILLRGGVAPKMSKELLAEISSPNKGGRAKTIVDIALDQGGNFYGSYSRPYDDPVFVDQYGNRRFCVTNMPDAVGRVASIELEKTNIALQIALAMGFEEARRVFPELESGLNVAGGKIICKAVSDSYADVKGREDLLAATKFLSLGYFTDNAKFINSLVDATNDTYWDGDKEVIIALSGALLKAGQKGDYLEFLNKIRINENEKIQLRVQASIAIHEAGYRKESEEKFWMETVSKRGLHNYARISAAAALVKARYAGTGMIDLENTKYLFVIRALKRALMSVIIKGEKTRKTGIRATEDMDPEHSMPGVRLRILAMGALLWSGIDVEKNLSDLRKIHSDINVAMSIRNEAQAELLSYERRKTAQVPSAASSVRLSHLARHEFINALIKMFLRLNKVDREGFLLEQTIDHIKFYWFGEKYGKNSTFLDVFNKLVETEARRQKRIGPTYNDEISVAKMMVRLAGFGKMKVDQNFLRELKERLGQPMIEHLSVYKNNSVYAMRSHIGLALIIKDHAKLEGKLHRAAMEGTFGGDKKDREAQYEKWRRAPNSMRRVALQLEDEKISMHQTMSYNEFAQWAHDKAEERYPLSGRTAPAQHAVLYDGAIMGPQVPASGIGPSDSDDELVLAPIESDLHDASLPKGEVTGINSIFSAHGTHIGGVEKMSAPPEARRGDLLPGTGIGGERQNIGLGGTDIPEFRAIPVLSLPEEYYANGLDVGSLAGEISGMGYPIRIDEKSALIFSEKVTFDNGLGILLPKLANSGIKVAVIATNDTQRKLIDRLNSGKPENQKIVYAGSIAEATTRIKAARFFYFKIEAEADAGVNGVTNITIIAKKIIKILGNVCGISDARLLEQMYEAARKFAEAA